MENPWRTRGTLLLRSSLLLSLFTGEFCLKSRLYHIAMYGWITVRELSAMECNEVHLLNYGAYVTLGYLYYIFILCYNLEANVALLLY